jgi:O-antigen ligase
MKGRITITSIEVVMFGLVFYILFSKSIHGMFDIDGRGLMLNPLLAAYVFPFSMFIFSKIIIDDEKKIKILFICFSLIGLYLGLTGIFEHFHLRQFVFPKYIMNMWLGGQWGRARGPFLNSAVNGTVIGMIIIMLIHLILQEKIKWKKIFFIISVICSLTTLVFTLTRGCWISFAISLFIVTVFISRVRYVVIPGFLALVLIVTFLVASGKYDKDYDPKKQYQYKIESSMIERIFKRTSNITTVTGRFDLYNLGWAMFLERPFFGYGFGTFEQSKKDFISRDELLSVSGDQFIITRAGYHDTYMGVLIDLGLLGFGMYLFIIFYILRACMKLYSKLPREGFLGKDFAVISFGILLVLLLNIGIEFRFFIFPNAFFYSIAGVVVGLDQRISQHNNISTADRLI